jgi:ribosomal protein L9
VISLSFIRATTDTPFSYIYAVSGGGEVTTIASSNLSSEGLNEAEKHLRRAQIWGAVLASVVTKAASARAFAINRRSMTSPDVIKELGRAFEDAVGVELA